MKPKIVMGVEVECEYNTEYLGVLPKGSYHRSGENNRFGKNFFCESDGSLHTRKFQRADTAEIISFPFYLKRQKEVFASFKRRCVELISAERNMKLGVAANVPLSKYFYFNQFCGCHVHISVRNDKKKVHMLHVREGLNVPVMGNNVLFQGLVGVENVRKFRLALHKNMKKAFSAEKFDVWCKQYFRPYAAKVSKLNFGRKRNCEFNVTGMTIEHRGMNLAHVESWDDFFLTWDVYCRTLRVWVYEYYKEGAKDELRLEFDKNLKKSAKNQKFVCEIRVGEVNHRVQY